MDSPAVPMLYKRGFDLEFGTKPKRWFARQWLPMTVLRIQNGARRGDTGAPLVLNLDRGVMRLKSICHGEAPIPRWVYDRIREGGDIVLQCLDLRMVSWLQLLLLRGVLSPTSLRAYYHWMLIAGSTEWYGL